MPSVEWRKRSGVSSRSSSISETDVAEEISSSSVSPRVEMSDDSLKTTAVWVSLFKGRRMYLITRLDAGKLSDINLEYLASRGSFDAFASLYDLKACSKTNLRTKASSGSSSSFSSCSLRRLPGPPNSPVLVHKATSTRIVQADMGWSSALNAGLSDFLLRVACASVLATDGEGSSMDISTSV
ncbi:hypothetical protein ASPCADRAFT_513742 [Aspergillus carbonarius ITEM 5010]|uniref:Uncharacterized protein n=1 Tax=Aspergillus carbonarius (strain ITEM 5010) TaxID=602072 RepID=A0A1R3RUM0_ASPC5|nr:hypothetical protein ASPCADRAFT_513742 [Aspergillus carbonarius ITEM 5010]